MMVRVVKEVNNPKLGDLPGWIKEIRDEIPLIQEMPTEGLYPALVCDGEDRLKMVLSENPTWGKAPGTDHAAITSKEDAEGGVFFDPRKIAEEKLPERENYSLETDEVVTFADSDISFGSLRMRGEAIPPRDCILPGVSKISSRERRGWIYPVPLVEYTEEKGYKLWRFIRNSLVAQSLHELSLSDLEEVEEPNRSALHSLLVNLDTYERNVPSHYQVIGTYEILERTLTMGPAFADFIKGLRRYALFRSNGAWLFDDELYKRFSSYKRRLGKIYFTDTGANCRLRDSNLFRANWLFPWVPPKLDPEPITSEPVNIDSEVLEAFRLTVRSLLQSDKFSFFVPVNCLSKFDQMSTKKAREGPQWRIPPVLEMAHERGPSKVAHIPRELDEQRCAVVEEMSSLARIRNIDHNVANLLRAERRDAMHLKPGTIAGRLRELLYRRPAWKKGRRANASARFSYCRDFKKEGLTKPRILLTIMLEELHDRWPECDAFNAPHFFDFWSYENEGKKINAVRGHGLGMANSLTTLLQLVLEEMTVTVSKVKPSGSLYYNDDATVILESESETFRYAFADFIICRKLGLRPKPAASFIAQGFTVLCEQYVSVNNAEINDKTLIGKMEVAALKKAINCLHARDLSNSLQGNRHTRLDVQEMIEYWGYVLYPGEHKRGRIFGGWFTPRVDGVDLSFAKCEGDTFLTQQEDAAWWTYSTIERTIRPWDKRPKVFNKRFAYERKEFLEMLGQKEFITPETFRSKEDRKENVRSWNSYLFRVRKEFSRACAWRGRRHTYDSLYKKVASESPLVDIIPPIGNMREDEDDFILARWTKGETTLSSPYSPPPTDYLEGEFLRDQHQLILHAVDFPSKGTYDLGVGPNKFCSLREKFGTIGVPLHSYSCVYLPTKLACERWINPFAVYQALSIIGKRDHTRFFGIPPEIPEKKALIEKRNLLYGRALTPEEWIVLGAANADTRYVIWRMRRYWINHEKLDGDPDTRTLKRMINKVAHYPHMGLYLSRCRKPKDVLPKLKTFIEKDDRENLSIHARRILGELEPIPNVEPGSEEERPVRTEGAVLERVWIDNRTNAIIPDAYTLEMTKENRPDVLEEAIQLKEAAGFGTALYRASDATNLAAIEAFLTSTIEGGQAVTAFSFTRLDEEDEGPPDQQTGLQDVYRALEEIGATLGDYSDPGEDGEEQEDIIYSNDEDEVNYDYDSEEEYRMPDPLVSDGEEDLREDTKYETCIDPSEDSDPFLDEDFT